MLDMLQLRCWNPHALAGPARGAEALLLRKMAASESREGETPRELAGVALHRSRTMLDTSLWEVGNPD